MNDKEKYSLLSELLKKQHAFIDKMTDKQLFDYVESMSIFLKTNDPIYEKPCIATMTSIVKNIEMNLNSELEEGVKGYEKEPTPKPRPKANKITRLPENHKSQMTIENEKMISLLRPYTKVNIESPSIIKKIERLLDKMDEDN